MSLVGKKAPAFTTQAVLEGKKIVENFSLEQFIGEKYIILFFYPGDFTFVCPTEILEFQKHLKDFEQRDAQIIGCSTDSVYSHYKWLQTPIEQGGIQGVTYPLISDQGHSISENYGVLAGQFGYTEDGTAVFQGQPVSLRGLFIIDKQGTVRYETVSDIGIGRSVKETLRVLDALIYSELNGVVCPADWQPGQEAIKPDFDSLTKYLKKYAK